MDWLRDLMQLDPGWLAENFNGLIMTIAVGGLLGLWVREVTK